jgi:hypothetical protein
MTHKSDWDSGDTQYNLIVKIANKKAAEFVLEHYGPEYNDKINMLREECDSLIKNVVDNMPEEAAGLDENILYTTSDYVSYGAMLEEDPEDTDLAPYRSTTTQL